MELLRVGWGQYDPEKVGHSVFSGYGHKAERVLAVAMASLLFMSVCR